MRSPETTSSRAPARRHLTRIAIVAVAGLVAVASFLVAASSGAGGSVEVDGGSPPAPAAASGDPAVGSGSFGVGAVVVVEIVGAVQRPGVFRLPVGARVGDLVDAAGGYGPRVDTARAGSLNLAAVAQRRRPGPGAVA